MNTEQFQVLKRLMACRRGVRTSPHIVNTAMNMIDGRDTSTDRFVRRAAKNYVKVMRDTFAELTRAPAGIDGDMQLYKWLSPKLNVGAVNVAKACIEHNTCYKAASKESGYHVSIIKHSYDMFTKIRSIRKEWEAVCQH